MLKISITGRNLVVTPAIREFTEDRLGRLERALEGIAEAHVILAKEKYRHIAEVVVAAGPGPPRVHRRTCRRTKPTEYGGTDGGSSVWS